MNIYTHNIEHAGKHTYHQDQWYAYIHSFTGGVLTNLEISSWLKARYAEYKFLICTSVQFHFTFTVVFCVREGFLGSSIHCGKTYIMCVCQPLGMTDLLCRE